jgi:hypothetical protein
MLTAMQAGCLQRGSHRWMRAAHSCAQALPWVTMLQARQSLAHGLHPWCQASTHKHVIPLHKLAQGSVENGSQL